MDASELLRRADVAMYAAKTAGKNRYLRFRPEMMTALVERTEMEAGLRLAVDSGQIAVHYQPIVSAGLGDRGQGRGPGPLGPRRRDSSRRSSSFRRRSAAA